MSSHSCSVRILFYDGKQKLILLLHNKKGEGARKIILGNDLENVIVAEVSLNRVFDTKTLRRSVGNRERERLLFYVHLFCAIHFLCCSYSTSLSLCNSEEPKLRLGHKGLGLDFFFLLKLDLDFRVGLNKLQY